MCTWDNGLFNAILNGRYQSTTIATKREQVE